MPIRPYFATLGDVSRCVNLPAAQFCEGSPSGLNGPHEKTGRRQIKTPINWNNQICFLPFSVLN